ncbi:hypothetical protein MNBD_GAMMA12-3492 [hydrothermal vent metagenome]|uniref:Uncharacterized protein n=1 Tax=hydrothermal vent metagenome TaxID=652676 RepID=A0A3B0Z0K1_9ZZZZ
MLIKIYGPYISSTSPHEVTIAEPSTLFLFRATSNANDFGKEKHQVLQTVSVISIKYPSVENVNDLINMLPDRFAASFDYCVKN